MEEKNKAEASKKAAREYSKVQILSSKKYQGRKDLLEALLDGKKKYTIESVDRLIEKFMKGKVE